MLPLDLINTQGLAIWMSVLFVIFVVSFLSALVNFAIVVAHKSDSEEQDVPYTLMISSIVMVVLSIIAFIPSSISFADKDKSNLETVTQYVEDHHDFADQEVTVERNYNLDDHQRKAENAPLEIYTVTVGDGQHSSAFDLSFNKAGQPTVRPEDHEAAQQFVKAASTN
jgi:hypothetical protein